MTPRRAAWSALLLALLAVLPYLRTFQLPFISDDYLLLDYSRKWGPVSGWPDLFADVLYRSRTTSVILTWWIQLAAGLEAWPYQAASLALHVFNTWLVAMLGSWPRIGWKISVPAAAFFAVHEIHQEAVLWYSALPELLVFLFIAVSFLLTVRGHFWPAFAAYALALLSKESAVVVLPFLALPLWLKGVGWPRIALRLTPHIALTVAYAWPIFAAGASHLHLRDGTFDLTAPFWITASVSFARLLWVWGALSLAVLWLRRRQAAWPIAFSGLVWMAAALLPYSFLTYMHRAPSRHTYLAGLGVALLVGCAWTLAASQWRRTAAALAVICVLHNSVYVWLWKHPQYLRRAQPTETLVRYVRQHRGPFALTCWPYSRLVAESTVRVASGGRDGTVQWAAAPEIPAICIDEAGGLIVQQ
ncbi:MAG: hypothetical protein HY858_07450 [Candidatus Solibacter usitatus]|nr:hypothetical protein [Candidatus Solibacter usitatus]